MQIGYSFTTLARYNQWMNGKVLAAARRLPPDEAYADRGAFFGSVFATLVHLYSADLIWLKRIADHPAGFRALEPVRALPHPYDWQAPPFADLDALAGLRAALDAVLLALVAEASAEDYDQPLTYVNRAGETYSDGFLEILAHLFNHQTHHRGQITTLLTQAGVDIGVTDLIALGDPE